MKEKHRSTLRKILGLFLVMAATTIQAQTVSVDESNGNPMGFVNTLMDNACLQISNAKASSSESIAFFKNNGGEFPISEGVVIRSGKAEYTEGKYTGENISSQINNNGDEALEQLNAKSGQSPLITDVAFLEFDFVPLSSNFNFNFLFASNEYGEWQCVSSDVFAFLLTDLSTGETTNLAVIPETDIPVSVRNIKDSAYNGSCESDYPELFSSYQVDDPSNSTINMRGYTKVMNASADINPGNPYRIRLVIGDSNDGKYDSAIFLEAGSFNANVDLGPDLNLCQGESYVIGTDLDTSLYAHSWTFNGKVIPNENGSNILVNKIGTYGVRVTKNGTSCLVTDELAVAPLEVAEPVDLTLCNDGSDMYTFNLLHNNERKLGIDDLQYDLKYYATYQDLATDTPIPVTKLASFPSAGNQEIYVKLVNNFSKNTCENVYSFKLLINAPVEAHKPATIESCLVPKSSVTIDLTQVQDQVLGIQDSTNFKVTYYTSAQNAQRANNPITAPESYKISGGTTNTTLWARVQDQSMTQCYAVVDFQVRLNNPPPVDKLEDVVECVQYVLPELTHGNYFTKPGGQGRTLFAGDIITETITLYIFNGPDQNGCINESSFKITILEGYGIGEKYCGKFSVPKPPKGGFYTQPGGPNGAGVELPAGTVFTTNQVIYHYAEINGQYCRDKAFPITILPLPPVDQPANVVACSSYTLPPLENGNYYTGPGATGKQLKAGQVITKSQQLYVYNKNTTCTNEYAFKVTVIPQFTDQDVCGSYILPSVEVGGFYTAASGQGTHLPVGTAITSTQRVYYFANTTTVNCSDNYSFEVKVTPIPEVDSLEDALLCEGEYYTLPELNKGQYFTKPNREGKQLKPGQSIEQTTTVYINNLELGCTNESSFTVEIRPLPEVENFTDIYTCAAYELPQLRYGKYFTQSGGQGTQLQAGDIISVTQTLYVYNTWEDLTSCYDEKAFTVYVEGIDVGQFEDVSVCNEYILPELELGNYYTESRGQGKKLKAGQKITSTQKIYVYAYKGTRFICESEESFTVKVSYTPKLQDFPGVESCGNYVLPDLSHPDNNINYYWKPGGVDKIQNKDINVPGTYTIYVYASAKGNDSCVNETQFQLTVYPLLELNIEGATLCRNPETGVVESKAQLHSGLNPAEFEVNWYLNNKLVHTGADFAAEEAGEYEVRTVKLQPEKGADCNYAPTTVVVDQSGVPTLSAEVTAPFENIATVRVNIDKGFGEYEYQLDNGAFQSSNEFYDVASGVHTVTVRGLKGNCGQGVLEVIIIKHPKYFSPNKDGSNETWTIPDLWDHPEARIGIFDRYGKLLKLMKSTESWDGTFNGRQMPMDDYWFRVTFEHQGQPKEFKSHFSLIR